jgi:hypothetical protein
MNIEMYRWNVLLVGYENKQHNKIGKTRESINWYSK